MQLMRMSTGSQLIENHGIIGNMRSAALVAVDGTIDFLCFPSFDSPTVFAGLLDAGKGGFFTIEPQMSGIRHKQLYLPDTNILLTRYLSEQGVAEVTDFMPVVAGTKQSAYAHQIIRMVRVIKGSIRFLVRCSPRFDYARSSHRAKCEGDSICFHPDAEACPPMALHSTVPLHVEGGDGITDFTLKSGETASFAFGMLKQEEKGPAELLDPGVIDEQFQRTSRYWRDWMGKATYKGRWREMVNRSALVLKILFSQEHGSMVAAVTFGLPEEVGGSRNWDYRYTWLRDSAFSLYALVRLGYSEEAHDFTMWLRTRVTDGLSAAGNDGPLRVMYSIDGSGLPPEQELSHLEGYKGSRPVRIGNGADVQLQLDIYGEIMDAIYLSNKYSEAISKDQWRRACDLINWLRDNWDRPDEGIWEVRNGRKHLLHSRLMCWVAFDRAIRLALNRSLSAPLAEWYEARDRINEDILDRFWDEDLQCFVQAKGEKAVDASVLLMPILRFISPTDPRWLKTMEYVERCLTEDNLVFRYVCVDDGLEGREGCFTACSFWYIECLARAGQLDKARLLFDKMLGYANHLGLYSEQLGSSGEHLGNTPQALTHLALIGAATYLDRRLDGVIDTWA
jgi:GH15 family glucan-1,4-alpha-glucosidase